LRRSQIAAFEFYGKLNLKPARTGANCPWLIAGGANASTTAGFVPGKPWLLRGTISHPADPEEKIYIFERKAQ
jgi:hypothetical protein